MGTLTFHVRSGKWRGSWVDGGGKQRRKLLSADENQARETLSLLENEAVRNRYLGIRPLKQARFAEFADRFLENCKGQIKAWPRYQSSLRSLTPFFGNRFLTSIDAELIEAYRKRRLTGVTRSTINRDLQVLKRLFNVAIDMDYARENPVRRVKFFKESTGRVRYLTHGDFSRLHNLASDELKPLLVVAVNTGMRQGEMLKLTWAQVDLENGYISLTDTKTSTPRKVPLNDEARGALRKLRLKANGSPAVISDPGGGLIPARRIQWQFKRLLEQARIPDFRFHDLRHTCASWLTMEGVSLQEVMVVLGHVDIRMTLRYSHMAPDQAMNAVKKLDKFQQLQQSSNGHGALIPVEGSGAAEGTHNR